MNTRNLRKNTGHKIMANRKAHKILSSFLLAFLFISGHSFASDYSGVWIGKTIPQDPECGFPESFKLLVRGENFEAISNDVTGARSLSGKIENGKIKQSINNQTNLILNLKKNNKTKPNGMNNINKTIFALCNIHNKIILNINKII